ncbi:MAG: efflux RND transporter periplasmic adaptor subunit [Myxococcales bacterium]|nr:MAG: efflux RND transporter periplasmic adaptor subunit [Myxococcales bacterium]
MFFLFNFIISLFLSCSLFAKVSERTFIVDILQLQPQKFELKRRYIGSITTDNFSILRSKVTGTIASIDIQAEQKVKSGQLLVSINNRSQKAALEIAIKTHNSLKNKVARLEALKATNDITKNEVDEAQRELLNAQMQLEKARKSLEDTEIRAPFDGTVGVPRVVVGQSVKPDTAIISLRNGNYSISFLVPPKRIKELKIGQALNVDDKNGSITAIEHTVDPKTLTGFARAKIQNCEGCIIGESLLAQVVVAQNPQAIVLSRNAIYYDKGKAFVVKAVSGKNNESRAQITEVVLGNESEGLVEIKSGLSLGDRIVAMDPKRITANALLKETK